MCNCKIKISNKIKVVIKTKLQYGKTLQTYFALVAKRPIPLYNIIYYLRLSHCIEYLLALWCQDKQVSLN